MTETCLAMFMYLFDAIIAVSTDKGCIVEIIDYNFKKVLENIAIHLRMVCFNVIVRSPCSLGSKPPNLCHVSS